MHFAAIRFGPLRPRVLEPFSRVGDAAWRTVTNVRFAVLQITLLVIAGFIGTLVRQVPSSALHDPAAYALEMADMHRFWDAIAPFGVRIGPAMVDTFDRVGFFRIFSAPWFVELLTLLAVSIVCGTLNRLPKLWREVRRVAIVQPPEFFNPVLANRALLEHVSLTSSELATALRSQHFKVRSALSDDEDELHLYGVRNQYMKLSTLLTHLGLVLFLVAGAVTVTFGYETVLFVGNGDTAPVQPVGTPHNLLVKNVQFSAPRLPNGAFADFSTDLEVYQDGQLIARKSIRVNDPLQAAGFVFHQNTFGPSVDLRITDPAGHLVWTGPALLEGVLDDRPEGFKVVPGSDLGLLLVLDSGADGVAKLAVEGLGPPAADGSAAVQFAVPLLLGDQTHPAETAGYTITWNGIGAWSGMVVKKDPGQMIVWIAFICLISGLILTFYFPRRRVWARLANGRLQLTMLADRYVDVGREFERLLAEIRARSAEAFDAASANAADPRETQ